jgi:tRNA G18 (ribose-2'-O)-methylase SpoU
VSGQTIISRDNRLYKKWLSLQTSKGIDRNHLALVSGRKIVPELAVEQRSKPVMLLVSADEKSIPPEAAEKRVTKLSRKLFDELDEFGTDAPLLVLPVPELEKFERGVKPQRGLTLALAAQDPSNLGAILRSALAFEVSQVVLLAECAHPFLPRVTRAAAGANFRVKLLKGPSIKELDTEWIALDVKGDSLDQSRLPQDCALLMGEEGLGIPESFQGRRLRIPISPRAESLNVAVAAGIVLAAYRRQNPASKRQ